MANVRNGNTYYVDTAEALTVNAGVRLKGILVTATSANAICELKDTTSTALKGSWRVATSGASNYFYFYDSPLAFPTGITISTLTNATALLVLEEGRG